MTYGGWLVAEDVLLAAVTLAALAGGSGVLAAGAALGLAWGLATLHRPSRVSVDDDGVTFARYGRAHRFDWRDVRDVRVRRFLVRDRVLVRIEPSAPMRGRYWLHRGLVGFDELVARLEARRQEGVPPRAP